MPEVISLRLFVALVLPKPLLARLTETHAQLVAADTTSAVRFVRASDMHLTLRFLGEVDAPRAHALQTALAGALAGLPAPELGLAHVGAFPNLRRPRVLWVGIRGDDAALAAVHTAVTRALVPLGFAPEERAFQPHLTVGRVRESPRPQLLGGALQKLLETMPPDTGPAAPASEVVLFRSHLGSGPPRYERLATFALGV